MKTFISKIKLWLTDHYHILFKSAADNHLRIQNILKNSDGTYQLTVKFASYTELKNYQKKVRRATVSLSSAVAMIIIAVIVSPYLLHPNRSSASMFAWTQNSWTAAGTTVANQSSPSNFSEFTGPKNVNIDVSGGKIAMAAPTPQTTGDTAGTAVNDGNSKLENFTSQSGFYPASDASGTYSAAGKFLALKKPNGGSCTIAGAGADCLAAGATCPSSVCLGVDGSTTASACQGNSGCKHGYCSSNLCTNPFFGAYHLNSSVSDFSSAGNNLIGYAQIFSDGFETGSNPPPGWTGTATSNSATGGHNASFYAEFFSSTGSQYLEKVFATSSNGTVTWTLYIRDTGSVTVIIDGSPSATCTSTSTTWAPCTGSAVLSAGASHTFRMTAASGFTRVDDVSLVGAASSFSAWDTSTKRFGSASLNITSAGAASGVFLKPTTDIVLGNNWTVLAWVYGGDIWGDEHALLSDGSNISIGFRGGLYMSLETNGLRSTTMSVGSTSWYLASWVGTGGVTTMNLYNASGTSVAGSYPVSGQVTSTPMTYIGNTSNGANPLGHVDDLLIFKKVLSQAEIAAIAASATEYPY